MDQQLRVLMITNQYPTPERPLGAPFIVRQVAFLRQAGIDVDVFHFSGRKNLLNYLKAWWKLREYKSGKSYDLIHAQWGQSAAIALPKRIPWVITFRGDDLEGIIGDSGKRSVLGMILRTVSKQMARMANGVIVVSETLAAHISRQDYHVIPSGIDTELFRPIPQREARSILGLPKEKKLILFAALSIADPRKRYDLAQSAIDLLDEQFKAELVVATNVAHSQIPVYMSACDALLLTSVHEGSPNVVKESLACNLPVVSVDVGDVRQRLKDVDGCYVCGDATAEALAEALTKVLKKGERTKGRDMIASLDERITSQKVIEVYESVVRHSHQDERESSLGSSRRKLRSEILFK